MTAKASFNGGSAGPGTTSTLVVDTTSPGAPTAAQSGCRTFSGTWYCNSAQPNVTLSMTDGGSGFGAIYYTLDGSPPSTTTTTVKTANNASIGADLAAEGSRTIRLLGMDKAGNTRSGSTTYTVVTDRTRPTATVSMANGSGTVRRADVGDSLTITFNEGVDPATICSGWDGASLTGTATISHTGPSANDTLSMGGTNLNGCSLGSIQLGAQYSGTTNSNNVTRSITFNSATLALTNSRTTLVITLAGTVSTQGSSTQATVSNAGTTTWTAPTSSGTPTITDLAANTLSTSTANTTTSF